MVKKTAGLRCVDREEVKIWTEMSRVCMGKRKARKVAMQARYQNTPQKTQQRRKNVKRAQHV